MRKNITYLLLIFGFITLSVLNYCEIVIIDKATVYGWIFGLQRALILFTGFFYFWLLIRHVTFLNNIGKKINQYQSAQNRGRYLLALIFGITHMTGVYFLTEWVNQNLLKTSGKVVLGIINDCKHDRQDEYCLYQYHINGKFYQVQITNKTKKYKVQDTVSVLYYPKWPAISAIED